MPRVEQIQQKALEEFRERNKNKRKKSKNKSQTGEMIVTFICVFFLLSLLFLHAVKHITPKIDTSVGANSTEEVANEQVSNDDDKVGIDERLKLIQFNDTTVGSRLQDATSGNNLFSDEYEEKVVIPRNKKDVEEKIEVQAIKPQEQKLTAKDEPITKPAPVVETPTARTPVAQAPVPTTKVSNPELDKKIEAINSKPAVTATQSANFKVLVGKYQTAEQAQIAKSIIRDIPMGQNAFVKVVDGVYTLQIGSYTTMEQARAVAQELTSKSFPARVYYERPQSAQNAGF